MALHTIVYASSATSLPSVEQLNALLAASRESNRRASLTGMLLYNDGNFMQCLEGPEEAVKATYARIASDPGHKGVITLLDEPIAQRSFADWQMGFLRPTGEEWKGLSAANWERAVDSEGNQAPSDGYLLLQQFGRGAR